MKHYLQVRDHHPHHFVRRYEYESIPFPTPLGLGGSHPKRRGAFRPTAPVDFRGTCDAGTGTAAKGVDCPTHKSGCLGLSKGCKCQNGVCVPTVWRETSCGDLRLDHLTELFPT